MSSNELVNIHATDLLTSFIVAASGQLPSVCVCVCVWACVCGEGVIRTGNDLAFPEGG